MHLNKILDSSEHYDKYKYITPEKLLGAGGMPVNYSTREIKGGKNLNKSSQLKSVNEMRGGRMLIDKNAR